MSNPFPALRYLFTCYFHEDYDEEGRDWPEVVDYFAEHDPHRREITLSELDSLLATPIAGEELLDVIRACGSVYIVEPHDARSWLQGIRDRLAATG